ncbi:MAG: secretin, partial [Mesorhizobium sp.]
MFGLFTYRVMGRLRILRAVAVASSLAAAAMLAFGASARADNDIVYVSSTKNASIKVAKGKPKTIMTSA